MDQNGNSAKIISQFNWDFSDLKQSERQYSVHFFHPYPAKFIPQIPSRAIKILSKPGDIVLDPFMGSGTTLVEAKYQGLNSIGLDTNPLAVKIAKAKTMSNNKRNMEEISNFMQWLHVIQKRENSINNDTIENQLFVNSHLWFRKDVESKIKIIIDEFEKYSPEVKNFLQVGLSSILKGISNARMDSIIHILPNESTYIDRKHYYRLVDNNTRRIPVFNRFYLQLNKMKDAIGEFNQQTDKNSKCKSIVGDSRNLTKYIQYCNLVITSPPYWSAQNYEENQKLSFELYGLRTIKGNEIGKDKNVYLDDMEIVFQQIAKILNGYLVLVIGEDQKNSFHQKLLFILKDIGFNHIDTAIRKISNQTSRAKIIQKEYIFLLNI